MQFDYYASAFCDDDFKYHVDESIDVRRYLFTRYLYLHTQYRRTINRINYYGPYLSFIPVTGLSIFL